MAEDKKKSIFQKIAEMSHLAVDSYVEQLKKSNPEINKPFGVNVNPMRNSWDQDLERSNAEYGFKQKLTILTDNHKLLMYLKDPIIASIIQTRITQAIMFANPQKDKYSPGFRFERKENKDPINADEQATIHMLEQFVLHTGLVDDERKEADEEMSFEKWMKLSIKDALIYDAIATEIVPDGFGKVHHWLPASAATMRLTAKNIAEGAIHDNDFPYDKYFGSLDQNSKVDKEKLETGKYKYAQVVNGNIRKVFTTDEMIYEFRNPVNDFFTNGYSLGELDLLMNVVSAHLNAENYNRGIFTHGLTSQGIINLKGEVDDEQLKAMRRSWYAQGVGSDAMFRTPIINTPDGIEFIKLETSHRDLEYSNYIQYLVKLMCAMYQIAPEELGFSTGGKAESDGNSQNYNNVERKLKISMDRGLGPLLKFIENIINDQILPKFSKSLSEKYVFKFVGLNSEDRMIELERLQKEGNIWKTINEIRAEQGFTPLPGADNLVLNAQYLQWYMAMSPEGQQFNKEQSQQEQQQSGGEQQPGEEGASPEDQSNVEYVDENGNPVNPEDIDHNSVEFEDENGNKVDKDGNPIEGTEDQSQENKLPWEEDKEESKQNLLPWEEGAEEEKKLPFEK